MGYNRDPSENYSFSLSYSEKWKNVGKFISTPGQQVWQMNSIKQE